MSAIILASLLAASALAEPEPEISIATAAPASTAPSAERRRTKKLTFQFVDTSLQKILDTLAAEVGVEVLYDERFRDRNVSFEVRAETFEAVLRQLLILYRLRASEIGRRAIVVFPEDPERQRHYERYVPNPLPAIPNPAPFRQSFTDASLKKVLIAVGDQAGLKVVLDDMLRDRQVSIRFDGETLQDALDALTLPYNLVYTALDASTIVVAPDNPQIRRRYGMSWEGTPPDPALETLGCGARTSLPFGEELGSAVRFDDGVEVDIVTRLAEENPPTVLPVYKHTTAMTLPGGRRVVDRVVSDADRKLYVGYRLELKTGKDGRGFVVGVQPLPGDSWRRLCVGCPASSAPKIARLPEPFQLGAGGSFALDLMTMTSSAGGRTIVDVVKIQQPSPPSRAAVARRFRVQWAIVRNASQGLEAGVCIRDLESGEALGGIPRFRARPMSDNLVLAQDGRTKDGKPTSVVVRMAVGEDRRTVIYAVELWEAGDLVHAEETRLPLPPF
jgi:hypothetical protein